ncbi:MAG: phosphoglycerate kinase [Victivallaceae bacterium]
MVKQRLSIRDMSFNGRRVLLRVDFNVPLKDGRILDDTRIKASLPTIEYLLKEGAKVILMSHLGDPKSIDMTYSLKPIVKILEEFLGRKVGFVSDFPNDDVGRCIEEVLKCQIVLLENLRFHKGEKNPNEHPKFAMGLASLGDLYVNDAFGTCHRKHASVYMVPQYFPGHAGMGFLVENEIDFLGNTLNKDIVEPFTVLLGGSKITSKIGVINALINKASSILLGGGMGLTFLKAQGLDIGQSLFDAEGLPSAVELLQRAKETGVDIVLPVDVKIARDPKSTAREVSVENIPQDESVFDIGSQTVTVFDKILRSSGTVFWNGPVGMYEVPPFDTGSLQLARIIALSEAVSIVGGGDAAAVIKSAGVSAGITHVSTGGGASLEFIEHGNLPGIDVLSPGSL